MYIHCHLFVIIIGRFKVLPGVTQDSIRLQNVSSLDKYLTIRPQYCVKEIVSNNRVAYYNNSSSCFTMYYTQDEYTSDCNLIPHYTDTTDDITFVSFTSATHDSVIITIQQDGHITVSTDNNNNDDATQFRFVSILTMKRLNLFVY